MVRKTRRSTKAQGAEQASFASDDLKEAKKALFHSVEQPESPDDLLRLFTTQRCGEATNPKEQKELLCATIQNFHTHEIRRFCNALVPRIEHIVATEAYVPEAVRQEEEDAQEAEAAAHHQQHVSDDDDDDDDEEQKLMTPVRADAKSSKALHYLRLSTLCMQTYLDTKTNKLASSNKSASSPGDHESIKRRLSCNSIQVPEEFMHVVTNLHEILLELDRCGAEGKTTQSGIYHLCESVWHANLADRAQVAPQTFSVCLLQALDQGETARRWTRLFELRHVCEYFDWEDESTTWLRTTILRLASDPYCLKHAHGKRFLAFLLQLQPDKVSRSAIRNITNITQGDNDEDGDEEEEEDDDDDDDEAATTLHPLAADLHLAIKVQVPTAKTSILSAYGDIYWRAWKETDDELVRKRLETTVWQEWIYAALHLQQPASVKAVQTLLQPLHTNAKTNETGAELLHRLYGPVIWRSLRATNAVVRLHAADCLAAVFPLTTPSGVLSAMNQSCEALQALLEDTDDRVRVAGTLTAGKVLSVYWDAIPATILRSILNIMVTKLASDASSATVRASVLQAVGQLLENPATHAVLRPLLPSLGNLLHDRVARVRSEAVRMLLQIKRTSGLKYYHVVPVHHLLARLASEGSDMPHGSPTVAQGLTALMLNSYFPSDPKQAVQRAVRFLKESPPAAKVFYGHIADTDVSTTQIVKVTLLLWNALVAAILQGCQVAERSPQNTSRSSSTGKAKKRRKTANRRKSKDEHDENQHSREESLLTESAHYAGLVSSSDTTLWGTIAETVSTLWGSIENNLDQSDYNECKDALLKSFSGQRLSAVLTRLEQGNQASREDRHRTTAAILHCAGRLPAEAVDELVLYIAKVLGDKSSTKANLSAHVALLCLWNKTEQVVPVLASSLNGRSRGLFRGDEGSARAEEESIIPKCSPSTALKIFNDLLCGFDPSCVAARDSILLSAIARTAVSNAFEKGLHTAKLLLTDANELSDLPQGELDHVLKLCELYGRFALHMQGCSDEAALNHNAETLLHWTTNTVLPILTAKQAVFDDTNISRISFDQSFRFPLSPFSPAGPRRRSKRNQTPTRLDTDTEDPAPGNSTNVVKTCMQQDLAVSILQANCLLFTEWLFVGRPGAFVISQAATSWSASIKMAQDKLLPAFVRLSVQLIKACHDSSLLRDLIVVCSEKENATVLHKGLQALLPKNVSPSGDILKATISSMVEALEMLCNTLDVKPSQALPTSVEEAWPYSCGAMYTCLSFLTTHPTAQIEFAKQILQYLPGRSEKFGIVTMHCLFALMSSEDLVPEKLCELIRGIETSNFDAEGHVVTLIKELKGVVE